ncbi:hypothetical protein ACFPWU_05465 [Nocardioides yefusunii]|uniref:Uncharacterized protein n=1 Tax=Nocardioides yefusunii TaxID=2500546 RepID=A0ABW1QZ51_9ACTN|nr:hypothetical protein [Nocardioides yefusunii]
MGVASAALLTAGAAVAASFRAMFHVEALLDIAQEQTALLHQERRQEQAAQIAVVATRTSELCQDASCRTLHSRPAVEVVNTSTQPVFAVTLTNPSPVGPKPTLATVPPTVSSRRSRPTLVTLSFDDVLPLLGNPRFAEHLETRAMTESLASEILDDWEYVGRPGMQFTDAAGFAWVRRPDGGLESVAAPQ